MRLTRSPLLLTFALAFSLTGCMVGPEFVRPSTEAAATWNAPKPHGASLGSMAAWWSQFDDPTVARLVATAEADSPTLAQASAAIERARASLQSTEAGLIPNANAGASVTRSHQDTGTGGASDVTARSALVDASWEIDLFGKVRRGAQAAQARVDARVDDWHDARVSLAAEVADTYVQYRACELLVDVYEGELASVRATDKATSELVRAGFTAPAEGALASASVASTSSTLIAQRAECDLLVKSLVALTGQDEPSLRSMLDAGPRKVPQPTAFQVDAVPADLIRQRPDVASLEREAAATSAEIGVAQADLYPSLSLSGSISVSASSLVSGTTGWSFGPSISVPIFDGGRRRAAVRGAEASYDGAVAAYRQGVRQAVKEVEQSLVTLDRAARQTDEAERATRDYERYLRAIEVKWRAGMENLLTLEQARRTALAAEVQELAVKRQHVQAWISLYKAVGGGWTGGSSTGVAARSTSATPSPLSKD